MSDDAIHLDWKAPGPIAARFMASTAMVQILNGPIGSGKTTAALIKAVTLSAKQKPSTRRRAKGLRGELWPVRRVKVAAVRDTYRQLWRTTLPSWFRRVPKDAGDFQGAENAPATHRVNFLNDDETITEFQIDFGAIGENAVEDFMRGYEPTFWYLNELDLLSRDVMSFAQDRAGRFPEMDDGGSTWRGVLADCNAPEFESWLWQDPDIDPQTGRPKPGIFTMTWAERAALGCELFIQPGGREPTAENLENLPAGYYTPKIGQSDAYIARMIDNKAGYSTAGKPVHPGFRPSFHVAAQELAPLPGVALTIGFDPRTHPSAAFIQRLANGQRRIVDELQGEQNMGPRRFGALVAQLLHDRYPFLRPGSIRGMCDPTAMNGVDREAGDKDWIEIVSAVTGIRIDPAPSNNLDVRREAVRKPLGEAIDGEPALLVSPRCAMICAGLASGYRFRKLNAPGATRYGDEVEKNHFADLCEALEYGCLADGAELEIAERKNFRGAATAQREAQHDYNPFGGAS